MADVFDQLDAPTKADVFDEVEVPQDIFDEVEPSLPEEPPVAAVETPAPAPPVPSPHIPQGFDQMTPVERSRIAAQAEIDQMEARKALDAFGRPEEIAPEELEDPSMPGRMVREQAIKRQRAEEDYALKTERFKAIDERYSGREAAKAAAAEEAARQEKVRADYEASGQGPNFLDAGVTWLTGKVANMASGALETFAPSAPKLAEVARDIGIEGKAMQDFSMVNRGPAADIARGGADVATLMLGNPAGFIKTIGAIGMKSANEVYGATLAQTGNRGAAAEAAQKTYRDTLIYAAVGAAAAKGAGALVPETMTGVGRAVAGGAAATGANIATSASLAGIHGEEYGLQQLAADIFMGGAQGIAEARNAPRVNPVETPLQGEAAPLDVNLEPVRTGEEPSPLEQIVPAIRAGEEVIKGNRGEEHKDILNRLKETDVDKFLLAQETFGKDNFFVDPSGRELSREQLQQEFGVRDSQHLRELQAAEGQRRLGPGAANIEEPIVNREPVGAWNAKVDEQRAARGLPPLASEARRADETTWDAAEQRMTENPDYARNLVDTINEGKKEAVSDTEQAALLREMVSLREARDQATARAFDEKTYSEVERAGFLEEAKAADERLERTEEADRKSGTAQGRALRIRRLMSYEDFTLGGLMGKARRAKGEDLTSEEATTLKTKADRFQKAKDEFESRVEEGENLPVSESIRRIEAEASKDPTFTPEVRSLADRIIVRLEEAAKGASERIRGLMSQLGSAPDVSVALKLTKDLAIMAAADIGRLGIKTTLKFTRWATKMVKDFGEKIEPYLKKAWDQADAATDAEAARAVGGKTLEPPSEAQKALDTAMVERERIDQVLAGEIAPSKRVPKEALTELENDVRAEIAAMRGLAAEIKSAERPKADPNTVRENAQVAALERAAAEYERRLNDADFSGTRKKLGPDTRKVSEARLLRDAAKAALDAARKLANPPKTKEEIALQRYKTFAARKTAEIQDRIDKGDFAPRAKKAPLDLSKDPQAIRAKAEMDRVRNEFQKQQVEWERAQRTRTRKFIDGVKETLATSRSLITSADVSAPFRQGGFLLLGDMVFHPVRATKQVGTMFRQLASEKGFEEAQAALALRPNAKLYDQSGLYLADMSGKLSGREESMRSNLAEKIPVLGRIVRASNRAYAGFLNRQRADSFDAMVESMGGPSKVTPEQTKAIANFVNTATGRGTVAQLERAADVAARYFFSPRFLASRFQLALGQPLVTGAAKKVVAQQYAKFAVGLSAIYGLALLNGGTVERDPRSADFGKAKFGDTRVDPLSGLAQVTTFMARMATGQTKQGNTVKKKKRSETFTRFARTKLAPIPGVAADFAAEQTLDMKEPTIADSALRLTIPLSYQSAGETYKEQGPLRGTVFNILNLLGMGVNTYEKR